LTRKIHLVRQTADDLKENILKKDKVILSAFADGVILHGADKFLEAISDVRD
jgi:hypothetical protein